VASSFPLWHGPLFFPLSFFISQWSVCDRESFIHLLMCMGLRRIECLFALPTGTVPCFFVFFPPSVLDRTPFETFRFLRGMLLLNDDGISGIVFGSFPFAAP